MKIAMIGHKYVPSREGGVEIVVEDLSLALKDRGNDLSLFNRERKEYKRINEYQGMKIENIFTINKRALDAPVYSYFATKKAKKEGRKGEYDILHFHAEGPCLFLNQFPKKDKRKYRIVVTIHGLDWQRSKWGGLATRMLLRGEKEAVRHADRIIVLSESVRDYFKKTYQRDTILIPNGVDVPQFEDADIIKQEYGLTKESYVLFLARIVPEKGLDYLIDAWKNMTSEEKKGKKLVIAGGASHSEEYLNQVKEKAKGDPSILFTGFVTGKKLAELYTNAYLYVLPSDIEGMPMSLLEAQSYQLPCLVSDIPENTAILEEGNYSFHKGDSKDLKDKLVKIFSLSALVHKPSTKALSWEEVAEKTEEVYREALSE